MYAFAALSLVLLVGESGAFFPNRFTNMELGDSTFTHQDITEIGILKAVAAYFEDNPRNGSDITQTELTGMEDITAMKLFKRYYGDGATGSRLTDTINRIVAGSNWLYKDYFDVSALHFNGERIKEANDVMTDLRETIINVLLQENANFDLAAELIGEFLHTMQMFYSNTNWVELFGSDAYYTLGDPDDVTNGKCSHGGPFDLSGVTIAALGGINKDSVRPTFSPHYHLHQAATEAAIHHTTFFFNDNVYGLRNLIGEEKYEQFLQLKAGSSLVFIIDDTASMHDDIEAVKEQVVAITQATLGTIYEPSNYIVVLFNDPVQLTRVFQTEDGQEAIQYIQNITVFDGGDCSEYAMDGIEKALQVCNPNSKMYIFTDAPAKDAHRAPVVQSLALQKNVELIFFVTNGCGTRKRRESNDRRNENPSVVLDTPMSESRRKRSTNKEDLYRALAVATGGSMYLTNKRSISKVAGIIKETFAVSVTILKTEIGSKEAREIDINVDDTIRQLTIEVSGSRFLSADLHSPPGETNVIDLGVGKLIKINDPIPGIWRLNIQNSNPLTMKVTAQSTLDISSTFVQMDPITGFEYEIIGRPVAGDDATIVMFVPSKDLINTLDMIQLLDSKGHELARYDEITPVAARPDAGLYRVQFPLPTQDFQVAISGEDTAGNRYTRLQIKRIVPAAIQLYLLPISDTLYVNELIVLDFVVVNKGENTSDIKVAINNDQNFDQSPANYQFRLDSSQNATENFTIKSGPTPDVITTVTISANTISSNGDSSQYIIRRLFTKSRIIRPVDNTPPVCNITSVSGNCDAKKLDPCTCSQYKWSGIAAIGDEGFGLYQISSSVKDGGSFSHDPFTQGQILSQGTIQATVGSTCCNPRIYITAVDMDSNTGLCVFDLAPEQELPLPGCTPTTEEHELSQTALLIILAVAGVLALIVFIIVGVIICIIGTSKKTKKGDDDMYSRRSSIPRPRVRY